MSRLNWSKLGLKLMSSTRSILLRNRSLLAERRRKMITHWLHIVDMASGFVSKCEYECI